MSQIHAALSHYWHLRDQGLHPYAAQSHVLQRFGIAVDTERPMASTAEIVREPDPNQAAGFGEDFCKTISGVTSNPQGLFGTTASRRCPRCGATGDIFSVFRDGGSTLYHQNCPEGGGYWRNPDHPKNKVGARTGRMSMRHPH